ncbi:DNA repair exonuclease [Paracoccus sp. (in: a-proteobacteria)]|uniref:metallophosphoesterase family protein n=1 Tax=Paracoccus sp. TaxID=267 RepID=UPI0026DEF0B1|nr:DNA repair exonuclease [Paracoccus sp. (in: a-proteobacteria)]MDO5648708.1 DNA repair exonuclease [Paracoccus sp. (in: a-proteobacteria)]
MSFRFIHTADLHLDAPLTTIALRDRELADAVGAASRTAFSRIVDLCIDEDAAFLLIAGDLWDGEHSSTKTPRFLKQELLRLNDAGIRCFIIRGNHDALARQTGELDPPENTVLFGGRPSTIGLDLDGQRVAIHGLSFRDAHAADSLLPRYPAPSPGAFNIGMMHTSLNGSPGHDPYAPCSVSDLEAHGYDYWALGHIHRRAEYLGRATIVMPGIPQGRDIGEAGPCSVTLVHVADDNAVTLERRSVASLRFERVDLNCDGVDDWAALLAALERDIKQARQAIPEVEHLVIRPVLRGVTPLAWRIARDQDRLTEEARAFAAAAGIWIDKLELRMSSGSGAAGVAGAHLPDELVRTVLDDLPGDPGLAVAMTKAVDDLLRDLPAELRDILGQDETELAARCQELLAHGTPGILARLTPDEAA